MTPKRVGLLGGSFDPVHNGHIQMALGAGDHFDLDEIYFIPCGQHAFGKQAVVSDQHRVAMLHCALQSAQGRFEKPVLRLDRLELEREGVSYTVTTCEALRERLGDDATVCLILGTDVANDFHKWYQWRRITELVNIVLVDRAHVSNSAEVGTNIDEFLPLQPDRDVRNWLETEVEYFDRPMGQVARLQLPPVPCSSTQIRTELKQRTDSELGKVNSLPRDAPVRHALDETVLEYILEHRLYC